MREHGHDAGHCSNGLTAQNYRGSTAEDRATYRKWIRDLVVLYGALLLVSGVVAFVSYSGGSLTQLTSLSSHSIAASAK
jgi:hypothetical protein